MNDKRCTTCKWWEASDVRWWEKGNDGVPGGLYGDCNNVSKLHEGHLPYGLDHLVYQYSESGGFTAGKDFGCVHWERQLEDSAISRCRKCNKELSVGDHIEGTDLCPTCYAEPVVEIGENPNGICPRCHMSWKDVPKLTSPEEAGMDIRINTGGCLPRLGLEITKLETRRCPRCGTYGIDLRMDRLAGAPESAPDKRVEGLSLTEYINKAAALLIGDIPRRKAEEDC